MDKPIDHVPNPIAQLSYLLRTDPFELVRVMGTALTTAKYKYLQRCIGKGTVVGPNTKFINAANIKIGQNCLIQDAVYIRAGAKGRVTIGDRAAVNSFCRMFGHGTIQIGQDSQVGPGTLITTTGHDYEQGLTVNFKPVVIGNWVWIGGNVTILPGVEIGDHCVIGAGSVVTKSIPAYSVAVGVPARVIKKVHSPVDEIEELKKIAA